MAVRKQFHFRPSANGFYAWDVHRLFELADGLPVINVPLSQIAELDELWWYQTRDDKPVPRSIADHFRLMLDADLSCPVILCADGRVMDGMHRITKALALGHRSIKAVRLPQTPAPDHVDVQPGDLATDD